MKILHVFYSTLPSATGGDIRSRDLIESQAEIGLDVLALSSPFQAPAETGAKIEHFSGIAYHRSFKDGEQLRVSDKDQGLKVKLLKALKLFSFSATATDLVRREKPDIIHAHSTFLCAFAGRSAAKKFGVPLVYEVRSLWEELSITVAPSIKTRVIARIIRALETRAMRFADHVVVISEGLRRDVMARGIPDDRITVVGNGTNLSFVTLQSATISEKQPSDWVFAYIGNIGELEGLDLLIKAVRDLRARGWTNPVHIYGDGPALVGLKVQAEDMDNIVFFGPFEPGEVSAVYSKVDVIVNPRRRSLLADTVTPLKPLEAMAWYKPIITSSVGGMLELVRDGETGFVFEADDIEALGAALNLVKENPDALRGLTERARNFVTEERSWYANAQKYKALYEQLAESYT